MERSTYRPEVVDEQVEDTQNEHQHDGTPLSLEAHNNHDASNEAEQADHNPSNAPISGEDESDE